MAEQVIIRYRWECTCCLADGEVRGGPETTSDHWERLIQDDHRHISPQCPKLRYYTTPLENEYLFFPQA